MTLGKFRSHVFFTFLAAGAVLNLFSGKFAWLVNVDADRAVNQAAAVAQGQHPVLFANAQAVIQEAHFRLARVQV